MKSGILFLFLLITIFSNGQTATYVQSFGSANIEQIGGLQVNLQQEIFATGTFGDNMMIDNNNLSINGLEDIFLLKKDSTGQTIWTKTFGSNDRDKVLGLRLFEDTTLYFTGVFWDNIAFDNISLSANGSSIYIAKCDTSGNAIWAKAINGNGLRKVKEGVTDSQGNYLITGSFSNDLIFPTMTLSSVGIEDGFIAKYDKNGNFLWAKQFGYQQQTLATSILTNGLNEVYVAGQFNGRVIFGNDTLWAAAQDFDIFLARYDANGNLQFGKRFGGIYDNTNPKIGLGTFGKVVMAGTFVGLLNFDQTQIQTNNLDSDIFLATFAADGILLSAQSFGNNNNEILTNLTALYDDYILSGYFTTATQIGNISLNTSTNNIQNLVIRTTHEQLNQQPNVISYQSTQASSTEFAVPYGFPSDDLLISGIFQGSISLPVTTPSAISNGFTDIFLVGITLPPVSTQNIKSDLNLRIYPNPTNDFLTIELDDLAIYSTTQLEIINAIGQVEQNLIFDNQEIIRVPVYHLPKGIYFLRLEIDGKLIVRRFVKY